MTYEIVNFFLSYIRIQSGSCPAAAAALATSRCGRSGGRFGRRWRRFVWYLGRRQQVGDNYCQTSRRLSLSARSFLGKRRFGFSISDLVLVLFVLFVITSVAGVWDTIIVVCCVRNVVFIVTGVCIVIVGVIVSAGLVCIGFSIFTIVGRIALIAVGFPAFPSLVDFKF
jgi:hypothetical protein